MYIFFGVHPLRMTMTSSSTLKSQHEEEESMCLGSLKWEGGAQSPTH